jgi:hypothetical protein
MRIKDLYLCCSNFKDDVYVAILEEGKHPLMAQLKDVYMDICDRKVDWFTVASKDVFIITLK